MSAKKTGGMLSGTAWWIGICFILVIALYGFLESRWGDWFLHATRPENPPKQDLSAVQKQNVDDNSQMDAEQKTVMGKIGSIPYISEVYLEHAKEGGLIVSATAEIGTAKTTDKNKLAKDIALQFTQTVYRLPMPVAGSMIHITHFDRLIVGAALGANQEKEWTQSTGGGSSINDFVQFLQKYQQESDNILNNTWFYESN